MTLLRGAMQILGEISALHLNPFRVAESQRTETAGYIVVSYTFDARTRSSDVLFLRGSHIHQCVALDNDHRETITLDSARAHFAEDPHPDTTRVYLFKAPEDLIDMFLHTVSSHPCLKIKVDSLTRRQVQALLRSTTASQVLAERNDFSRRLPSLEFKVIDPQSHDLEFEIGFRTGGFLVYNTIFTTTTGSIAKLGKAALPPVEPLPDSLVLKPDAVQLVDDFAQFLEGFQADMPVGSSRKPLKMQSAKGTVRGVRLSGSRKAMPRDTSTRSLPPPINPPEFTPAQEPQSPSQGSHFSPINQLSQDADFVNLFDRLLRSFRQQSCEHLGRKTEDAFTQAERHVSQLNPGFSLASLDAANAQIVLDLIEYLIERAPILKRNRLRQAASVLIANIYDKHYDILERNKAIDRLEQSYYRLKR
jgi:hypothetical protein